MSDAREKAIEYIDALLQTVFEETDLDDLERAFGVETGEAMNILFEIGSAIVTIHWEDDCTCNDAPEWIGFSVGDPDPSPWDEMLLACSESDINDYHCSLPAGHGGVHIAGDGTEICAIWGNE